jgi:hypothetical protein
MRSKSEVILERNVIINEFLELRKLLNHSNKLANEPSQFLFKIEFMPGSGYRMYFYIITKYEKSKIELSSRNNQGEWERSGFTKFSTLENYCSLFLTKTEKSNSSEVTKNNLDLLFLTIESSLQKEFDDLLTNYAP